MLDQMSNGRVLFGIVPGGLSCDAELFDHHDSDERGRMMIEASDIMEYIWTHDPPYVFGGEFWNLSITDAVTPYLGISQVGKPFQKPIPPIAYAIRSPRSAASELAASRNWIPTAGNFIPSDFMRSQWVALEEASDKLGLKAHRDRWRVARSILVAESDAAAEEYVHAPDGTFRFYFRHLFTLAKMSDRAGRNGKDGSRSAGRRCPAGHGDYGQRRYCPRQISQLPRRGRPFRDPGINRA